MESYDPRKPIIKATEDDETDEVQGHALIDPEQPSEVDARTTEAEQDGASEVEGHRFAGR